MKFAAFYYPGFYSCAVRNAAAGVPIDEWDLLRTQSNSVFVNTEQVHPALGFTDCSEPGTLAQEASLAIDHGVDAFIFDYYFDGDREELAAPLNAFSTLRTELQFAINICCQMPRRKLPFGAHDTEAAPFAYLTEQKFFELARAIAKRFLSNAGYLRCNGRAVITMYHVDCLVFLYGPEGLRKRLRLFRRTLRDYGFDVLLVGLFSAAGGWARHTLGTGEMPFDCFSCYVCLPDFQSREPVQHFESAAERSLQAMQAGSDSGRPVIACVGAGWNATPRGAPGYDPKVHGLAFPYHPVVVGDEPVAFERYLLRASEVALGNSSFFRELLFLGPWNEWTEGCYLLPDTRYGLAKLEAVNKVKGLVEKAVATSRS